METVPRQNSPWNCFWVVSLPMRDGNNSARRLTAGPHNVVSLPMRDGNNLGRKEESNDNTVVSLPMRDGNNIFAATSVLVYPGC